MITDPAVTSASPASSPAQPDPVPADAAEHTLPLPPSFAELALPEPLLRAVTDEGYELPTPIQLLAIPLLMQGRDVIGQAQTGTGKTAAFSLPLLQRIDPNVQSVQALVLVPTRELALQVATAVHTYAQHLPRVSVLPIFGGDSMERQITRLGRGVHVVVGTPGRILDHLRRGSLDLSHVGFVVLDEADEMLRMGFLEDVEAILEKTPAERQTTLLSATLPPAIRRIAHRHLRSPEHVVVKAHTVTVDNTEQRVAIVPENLKLEAVARLLETEEPEATLIFTRTRLGAAELAEQLTARGFPAEALHSDLSQPQRLIVLSRLRDRRAQVVVATDVAARGLDIEHISHVINYDLPSDAETYVHRIGRTGRAGRAGMALLLATPYQRPLLRTIERFTQRPLTQLTLPTYADVAQRRRDRLRTQLVAAAGEQDLKSYRELCAEIATLAEREPLDVAAAALRLLTAERPLFIETKAYDPLARAAAERLRPESARPGDRGDAGTGRARGPHGAPPHSGRADGFRRERPRADAGPQERARILVAVGHSHGVRPGDIVGAIANEAGLSGRDIGRVEIHDQDSVVEIPAESLSNVLLRLRSATIRGQAARPRALSPSGPDRDRPRRAPTEPGADREHRPFSDAHSGFDRDRPQRRSAAEPGADREHRPHRPFADAHAGAENDRPPRRPFADSHAGSDHDRPKRRPPAVSGGDREHRPHRPFSDSHAGFEGDRPPRRPFSDSHAGFEGDRPPRRPFSDSHAGFEGDRPPRRPFSDSHAGFNGDRPPRRPFAKGQPDREAPPRRPFSDSSSGADRDRPPRRGPAAPAHGRAPARDRNGAGSWTWGAPAASEPHGTRPPKRRPR